MNLGFDVVEFDECEHPAVGETAPDFTRPLVTDEYWTDRSLSALTEESPVLLVFHPMDGDFPATYIWQEIRDRGWLDGPARPVGLSISSPYEHSRFLDEWELGDAALFSDPANGVAERYGIVHDLDGMAGVAEPRPATFLLGEDRVVRSAWVASEWPEFPPYAELETAIEEL